DSYASFNCHHHAPIGDWSDPHPSGPFVGFVLINDARFLVAATFSQDGSVIGDLIIDFHGLEPIAAGDVPYNMIGTKVEISRASPQSEIFDRLNAELEYIVFNTKKVSSHSKSMELEF
ncbi:hypothetical protein FOZ63_005093, partial [Perkinsus olseni]